MRHRPRPHHLIVIAGFVLGLLAGIFVLETEPPIFGWLFGVGAGTTGGAFFAAIASGHALISGPAPGREDATWYDDEDDDAVVPRLLDGLPPRRDAGGDDGGGPGADG